MKLATMGHTLSANRVRINLHYVSLVCGLALTVAAAVNAGALDRPASTASTSAGTNSTESTIHSKANAVRSAPSPVVFYIVDSQDQADAIEQEARAEDDAVSSYPMGTPEVVRSYLVADGRAADRRIEQLISLVSWDLWSAGNPNFEVVDLRNVN